MLKDFQKVFMNGSGGIASPRSVSVLLVFILQLNFLCAKPGNSEATAVQLAHYSIVSEIFNDNCIKCHGDKKQKGKYRLDIREKAFAGGESDLPAIVPSNVAESELAARIRLAHDDEDIMPPSDKGNLTRGEIQLILDWIAQGAYWPEDDSGRKLSASDDSKLSSDERDAFNELKQLGFLVDIVSAESGGIMLDLSRMKPSEVFKSSELIGRIAGKIFWLDLGGNSNAVTLLQKLPKMNNVRRLHLEGSDFTDKDTNLIKGMKQLEYLNIYNTALSNKSLKMLSNFSALKKIYIWKTNISKDAAASLKKKIPALKIISS